MPSNKKHSYISSVGRRKRAIARVRLMKGKEEIIVNGQSASVYFPGSVMQKLLINPLQLTDLIEKYTATVKVVGSGKLSQLQAVIHGLSRAIAQLDSKYKTTLRSAGLLTRDPRKRQRRNIGTGGKARRRKQSPKR